MKIAMVAMDGRARQRSKDPIPRLGSAVHALLEGLGACPDVDVRVFSCLRHRIPSVTSLIGGIPYVPVVMPRWGWMSSLYTGCVWRMRRAMASFSPDVIHGQGTEGEAALSAVFSGFPNVVTVHGNMRVMALLRRSPPFSFHWLAARLESLCLRRADATLALSAYAAGLAGVPRDAWVIPNAVAKRFFERVAEPGASRQIVCIGTIGPRKNQIALLEALDPCLGRRNIEVVFYGGLEVIEDYGQRFLRYVQARPWARYGGVLSHDQVPDIIQSARAMVLASVEDNCPMVVLEAMAAGLPVAATRAGGIPELIEDGKTGLLMDLADGRQMQEVVKCLCDDLERLGAMGAAARRVAELRHHPDRVAERHVELYRSLMKHPRKGEGEHPAR